MLSNTKKRGGFENRSPALNLAEILREIYALLGNKVKGSITRQCH